ncbi:MAG: AgmX/PglI C-terminal domain-containing protein [Moraxellaceae bacterium]|nr:AgmX/PglI C-terminal domain-containing protein [Moraxellaceae bacterium]
MNIYEAAIITAIALSSATAIAKPPLKPLSNEEAAALLSVPPPKKSESHHPNLCIEITKNSQGQAERTAEQIRCNLDHYGQSLNDVYQRALLRNPKLEGSIVFNLVIEPSGIVISAEPIESTINNDSFVNALRSKLMAMKFPSQQVERWSGKHSLGFFSATSA